MYIPSIRTKYISSMLVNKKIYFYYATIYIEDTPKDINFDILLEMHKN